MLYTSDHEEVRSFHEDEFHISSLETLPLLRRPEERPNSLISFHLLVGIFTSLVIFIINIVVFVKYFDYYVDQAIHLNVDQVSLESFNFYGLNYHIKASLIINYDKISNIFASLILKSFGMIGIISIQQLAPSIIMVKPSILNVDFLHIANATLSEPIPINLGNYQMNILDFYCNSKPIPYNVVKFFDYLDMIPDDEVLLDTTGYFHGFINSAWLDIPLNNFKFSKKIKIHKSKLMPKFSTETLNLHENHESNLQISQEIKFKNEKNNLNTTISEIEWEVQLENCNDYSKIGTWRSSSFDITPGEDIKLEFFGIVDSIPKEILETCTTTSSLNKIVQDVISNEEIKFRIKAINSDSLPQWLLDLIDLNIRIPLKQLNLPMNGLNCTGVDRLNVVIDDDRVDLKLIIRFENILPLHFKSILRELELEFYFEGIKLGISLISESKLLHSTDFLLLEGLSSVCIENSKILSTLRENDTVRMKVKSKEVEVGLSIGEIKLNNLNFEKEVTVEQVMNLIDYQYSYNSSEVPLNATLNNVQYLSSTSNSLQVFSEITIDNQNLAINIPDEISIQVGKKNRSLSSISVQGINLTPFKHTIQAKVNVGPFDPDSKIEFEALASQVISGVNTTIDVDHLSSSNDMIDDLIQSFTLPNFEIPHFGNPFLIDSTIHLFGSTVELTLYNPINNHDLIVDVYQAAAKHENVILGELIPQTLVVPPGISTTAKLPIKISNNMGMDILMKYLNGDLPIDVVTLFTAKLDNFSIDLFYNGHNLKSNVRW